MSVKEPRCRQCRREAAKLYLKGDRCYSKACPMDREGRREPPGQHGERAAMKKLTEYGKQLREKQKLRRIYMVEEGIFRRYVNEAERRQGVAGENLLQLLETRLDNVIYRMGLAVSRAQARQIVGHGFVALNGRKVDVPSIQVRVGDVITIRESKRNSVLIKNAVANRPANSTPAWLEFSNTEYEGRVLALPTRDQINTDVREQVIIEFYSR